MMGSVNKIFLHCTYDCNAKCIHCAVPQTKSYMPLERYKQLVDIAKKSEVEYLIIGGGEPLLHPNILEMVKYASDMGIKVKIETNARLLNKEKLDFFRDYLFQLNVSLDGVNLKTHNDIRGINVYKKAIESIKYAL